jgi:hypothetical protein
VSYNSYLHLYTREPLSIKKNIIIAVYPNVYTSSKLVSGSCTEKSEYKTHAFMLIIYSTNVCTNNTLTLQYCHLLFIFIYSINGDSEKKSI